MKLSERIGLIALVVFFIFLAVVYFLPTWISGIIGLALISSAFALFATYLQHREEAPA